MKDIALQKFHTIIHELSNAELNDILRTFLQGQLTALVYLLGDDVPEEYYERLNDLGIF